MSEVRGSERSSLHTAGVADGVSDAPMDLAMDILTAVTPIDVETAGEDTLEPMDRKRNGMRRRRSEVPVAAWARGNWRSRMEGAAQQEACVLAQLHRTVAKLANMLETHTALQDAQW